MNAATPSPAKPPMTEAPVTEAAAPRQAFDPETVRADFPILSRQVRGKPLVYLDNAASAQRPACVIEALDEYDRMHHANVHRGLHTLSEEATALYEGARQTVADYLNAASTKEIVFVRGTTEGINLVAQSYVRGKLGAGDEILISELEHHSNIVPWQLACEQSGAKLRWIPINDRGELVLDDLDALLTERTALVSVGHVSNALGTVNPIRHLIKKAHAVGAHVLVDGAQAAPHMRLDMRELDCDFYAFSGHKTYAPTGIGVLYGKQKLLEEMPPWQGGGDMIRTVRLAESTWNDLPWKFEAGTPHISGAVGLGAALRYLDSMDMRQLEAHEQELLRYATEAASAVPGLRLVGVAEQKMGILSFTLDGVHPHDIGTILDHDGIAIRAGHHCAMPVMEKYGIPATARASFAFYNTFAEVDALILSIQACRKMFQ